MRISNTVKLSMAMAVLTICSLTAAAQQYQIVRADYGYGNQRVDVTQRLRDEVSNNAAFRMGNSTFGVDPAHGKVKSLRVYAKGPHGESRTFEYREGSTVESSQFVGSGGGNWGREGGGFQSGGGDAGEYTILHAEYGTERNHVDVTNRLRELARADYSFRMGNSTFGVDPDPGRIKTLRIYARGQDGRERMFEYRESSTIDGSQFRGWSRADWGHDGWNGGWSGGWNGGGFHQGGGDSGEYTILRAEYGTERNHVDVTDRLRELARADYSFRMGNSTFGVDPDPGRIKTLRIYARGQDGRERMFEYRESSTIDGSQFRGWSRADWGHDGWNGGWNGGGYHQGDGDSGEYVIVRAEYGTDRNRVDVTNQLRELARADNSFRMGNSTFGVDPDHGRIKTLWIYARGLNGEQRTFEYRESSTIDGSMFKGWSGGGWGQ